MAKSDYCAQQSDQQISSLISGCLVIYALSVPIFYSKTDFIHTCKSKLLLIIQITADPHYLDFDYLE